MGGAVRGPPAEARQIYTASRIELHSFTLQSKLLVGFPSGHGSAADLPVRVDYTVPRNDAVLGKIVQGIANLPRMAR